LVDEGAGPTGTGPIHPGFPASREEDDFGVFAAEFHHHVGLRIETFDRQSGGLHFLDERQIGTFAIA
jgi:hypothetical protein